MPETSQRPTTPGTVPPLVLVIAGVALIAASAMMIWGAYVLGITWDEKTNMLSLQEYFNQGWNITADALVNGQPDPAYIWGTYVYGPVSLLFAHAAATLTGNDTWSHITFTPEAYAVRHVAGALIGIAGIVAAGLTVRVTTRSWRWATLGAAFLAIIPTWVGHSMMDIKDGPVGTGVAFASLGLVMLMRADYRERVWFHALAFVSLAFGAFLASGTRAASGVPIAGAAVVASITWWLVFRHDPAVGGRDAFRGGVRRLIESGLAVLVAYGAMVLVYPNAFGKPTVLAYQAIVVSAKFPFNEPIMFAGNWIGQPVPWYYLPGWFAAQLPVLILVAAAGFSVLWLWAAVSWLIGRSSFLSREMSVMVTAIAAPTIAVPVIAILGRATMYNAVRQYLFLAPAIAVLATLGVWSLSRRIHERSASRAPAIIVWTVVAIGMIAPLVAQVRLFPYNYTYYNAVTALAPIDGNWPTDYWRASSREIMRRLPAQGVESCAYEQGRKGTLSACSDEPMFEPYLDERGADALPGDLQPGHYWLVRENQGATAVPEGCTVHDAITRPLYWQTITIAQILECPLPDGGA